MAVEYDKHLDDALASLHDEGRYRVLPIWRAAPVLFRAP